MRASLLVLVGVLSIISKPALAERLDTRGVIELHVPYQVTSTEGIHVYILEVLQRALDITAGQYGKARLIVEQEAAVQDRQILNLNNGISDVIWMISSKARDEKARAIPVPIIAGLYGYRVLLVSQLDERFHTSKSLTQLQQLTYVQGPDWPDLTVLRHNHFQVKAAPYLAGFRMLRERYVDAYPRAVHEVKPEIAKGLTKGMVIEPCTVIYYDNPLFFYVSKDKDILAKRLEEGLVNMISSGELQSLLESQPFYAMANGLMQGRSLVELNNPEVSAAAKQALDLYLQASTPDNPSPLALRHYKTNLP